MDLDILRFVVFVVALHILLILFWICRKKNNSTNENAVTLTAFTDLRERTEPQNSTSESSPLPKYEEPPPYVEAIKSEFVISVSKL